MRQVVKAISRAEIKSLFRLFGHYFDKNGSAKKYGAALVTRTLMAVATNVARVTPAGEIEFDVRMEEIATFANVLVQNKVDEAHPLIDEVICELMNELWFVAAQSQSRQ